MTLTAALNSATSSLTAIQTRMAVASSNIANADNTSYTAKKTSSSAIIASGQGVGTKVDSIYSGVDANLLRSIINAISYNSQSQTTQDYLGDLSDVLGNLSSTGSGTTVASLLSSLETDFDNLATTPESTTLKTQAVMDLDDTATSIRALSDHVQQLRANADQDIDSAVDTVNESLHTIDDMNKAIAKAQALGQPTADLEDQRMAALQSVAEQMDVTYYNDSNGSMNVLTGSGQVLVSSYVHEVSYTPALNVTPSTTFGAISVNGINITNNISSGNIASYLELRDTTLPAVQSDLDSMALSLKNTLNTISNSSSAVPPPNTLTGTESYTNATAFSGTGTLTISVIDATGTATTNTINLASYATVGALATALDAAANLNASLDANGHLVLSAVPSTSTVAVSGGSVGSENFSGYFGLNDLVTGTDATNIKVNPALSSNPSLLPVGTLNTTTGAVTTGSGSQMAAMADALRTADLTTTAGTIVSNVGTLLSSSKTTATSAESTLSSLNSTFQSKYGVNVDEENARITALQNAYASSAQIISTVNAMFNALLQAVK